MLAKAVHLDYYVPLFDQFPDHHIFICNSYTQQLRKYVIPDRNIVSPPTLLFSMVVIGKNVYMFGGAKFTPVSEIISRNALCMNTLWRLSETTKGCFSWHSVDIENKVGTPSPRCFHSGWEYSGKLWIFGGQGPSPVGYLYDHGDFVRGFNNQLLCFNPSSREWTNPKCQGSIPPPRAGHASTSMRHQAWVFGGEDGISC